jgi:hypothetical protein
MTAAATGKLETDLPPSMSGDIYLALKSGGLRDVTGGGGIILFQFSNCKTLHRDAVSRKWGRRTGECWE